MAGLRDAVTYGELIVTALRRFPDRVAFRQDGRELTYRETADLLARWITLFTERGLEPGEGVGILSPNRPEVWLGQSASLMAGGRYTALHPLGSLDDHRYACDEAELRFLLVDPAYAERAARLLESSRTVEAVFTFGPADVGEDLARLVAAVTPALTAAARYADVLVEQPARAHEFTDNRAIAQALAVIPVKASILVTNDLRYPADDFRREGLQMQVVSLFGHQAFAVNYMYEAYPFSGDRRRLQRLLEAPDWTPAIHEAARTHHWTHLLIRKDFPHPQRIPLEQIFDGELYSVFRFTPD